jgi:hypothetical protein
VLCLNRNGARRGSNPRLPWRVDRGVSPTRACVPPGSTADVTSIVGLVLKHGTRDTIESALCVRRPLGAPATCVATPRRRLLSFSPALYALSSSTTPGRRSRPREPLPIFSATEEMIELRCAGFDPRNASHLVRCESCESSREAACPSTLLQDTSRRDHDQRYGKIRALDVVLDQLELDNSGSRITDNSPSASRFRKAWNSSGHPWRASPQDGWGEPVGPTPPDGYPSPSDRLSLASSSPANLASASPDDDIIAASSGLSMPFRALRLPLDPTVLSHRRQFGLGACVCCSSLRHSGIAALREGGCRSFEESFLPRVECVGVQLQLVTQVRIVTLPWKWRRRMRTFFFGREATPWFCHGLLLFVDWIRTQTGAKSNSV